MNFGFSRTSRARRVASCGLENAGAEEFDASAAVHRPLQHLEAAVLSLDRTGRPGPLERGLDRIEVTTQPGGKVREQSTVGGVEQLIEALPHPMAKHRVQLPGP